MKGFVPFAAPLNRSAEARGQGQPGPGCPREGAVAGASRSALARQVLAQEKLEAPGGMQPHVAEGDSSLLASAQASLSTGHRLATFSALTSLLGQP